MLYLGILTLMFLLQSQHVGPDGNVYDTKCTAADPDNMYYQVEAWFNDPDGDCKSDDWIIEFTDTDGDVRYRDDTDFPQNPWFDFSMTNFDCCGEEVAESDYWCDCSWSWDLATTTLTIDCSDCFDY